MLPTATRGIHNDSINLHFLKATNVRFQPCTLDFARALCHTAGDSLESGIGHPATAKMLEQLLQIKLPPIDPKTRTKLAIENTDITLVCQYVGRRLAEGEIITDPSPEDFMFLLVLDGMLSNEQLLLEAVEFSCCGVRAPSRAYPYSLLTHCRSAAHVAAFEVDLKELKKAIRAAK